VVRLLGRWRAARPVEPATLRQLRDRAGRAQTAVAVELGTGQSDVSKLERRGEVQLSTLQRYVTAVGGRLEVLVRWPDGTASLLDHPALDR
jgi:transcriptional regulator with XRE-family HTH domain